MYIVLWFFNTVLFVTEIIQSQMFVVLLYGIVSKWLNMSLIFLAAC